jgi:hypothetical protein
MEGKLISQRWIGGFRLSNRRWYPALFVLLCAGFLSAAYLLGAKELKIEWVISGLGGAGGLTTFLYAQHLQETRLFTELFQAFNQRYNNLNQRLNAIAESAGIEIGSEDRQVLFDYFNLCGEEYLYFRAGYIDGSAWQSWVRGMKVFADVPAIRKIWQFELESGSYYGFSLRELELS